MGLTATSVGASLHKKNELKKHVAAIHCSNTLSLLQRKITNVLLFHAYPELLTKEIHEISVRELCRLIDYNGNNHAAIKDALRMLVSTRLEWNIVSDDLAEEEWTASSILASVNIKGPACQYAYSPHMKVLLHMPQMYGAINLAVQSKFRSSYGLALYENCSRYRNLKFTKWFDMEVFRKLMGVPEEKYKIFRDFKKRVLDTAVDEVNRLAGFTVEEELKRVGRTVRAVRFKLDFVEKLACSDGRIGQGSAVTESYSENSGDSELLEVLVGEFALSRVKAQQLICEHGVEVIDEKIDVVRKSKSYKAGKIANVAAYLLSAIRDDYADVAPMNAVALVDHKEQERTKYDQEENERAHEEFIKLQNAHIIKNLNELPSDEKNKVLADFEKTIEQTPYEKIYDVEGLDNVLVADEFCAFVRRTQKDWY